MHEDDGMMGQFVVKQNITGVTELLLNNTTVKVFPNPARDVLNVKIDVVDNTQPFQLKVYDVMGKIIYSSTITQMQSSLNTSNWAKGLYTVELMQNKSSIHKKIIIE